MVSAEFFDDARRFAALIEPLVRRDRPGAVILSHLVANHLLSPYPAPPLLAVVLDDRRVQVAALRVPGYPLVVVLDPDFSDADAAAALDELVAAVLARSEPVVGFVGRRRTARLIGDAWAAHTGSTPTPRMWELYYRLGELRGPVGVPGQARQASITDPADLALLADWFCRFRVETGVGRTRPVPEPELLVQGAERGEVVMFWCVAGIPVAAAGHNAVRDGASKIAPVYTPPDQRRRGYGAAATAAAVRSAQGLGASEITLFADAGYEPSNACYRGLGFEVIGEFAELDVDPIPVSRERPAAAR